MKQVRFAMELPATWQEALQNAIKAERRGHTRNASFHVGWAAGILYRGKAKETFRAISEAWRTKNWKALQQIGRSEIKLEEEYGDAFVCGSAWNQARCSRGKTGRQRRAVMMGVAAGLMGLEDSDWWNNGGDYWTSVCEGVLKAYHENRKADMEWVADRFAAQQRLTSPLFGTIMHADGTVTDMREEAEQWWKETVVRMHDIEAFGRDPKEIGPDRI